MGIAREEFSRVLVAASLLQMEDNISARWYAEWNQRAQNLK
jgi:hypothetical protein